MVSIAIVSSSCASCKEVKGNKLPFPHGEREQCPVFHKEETNMKCVPVQQVPSCCCRDLYQDAAELKYS
jgi:hypothetical protein